MGAYIFSADFSPPSDEGGGFGEAVTEGEKTLLEFTFIHKHSQNLFFLGVMWASHPTILILSMLFVGHDAHIVP